MRSVYCAGILLLFLYHAAVICNAGEYDFTIPEAEIKPYEVAGRIETRYINHRPNEESARYRLNYYQNSTNDEKHEFHGLLELSGSYRLGFAQVNLLTHHEYAHIFQKHEWNNKIYEGYLSLTPSANLTLDAGKRRVLWGKGYAWNPAGFINRTKDPDDPALNLEGRTLLGVDLIKSLSSGRLDNIGFTALLLPVIDDWANKDLGEKGDVNIALKLYLLWRDTDIDLIYYNGPEQPQSFAFDFSKNLAENIELHGELAIVNDVTRVILDAAGNIRQKREDQLSCLLGVRYLNALDTTFIAEYYRNGGGYSRSEIKDFFIYQDMAYNQWRVTGNDLIMDNAARITAPYYRQRNFSKDYFYLRVSQKEPFDILYFNPWVAAVVNLNDKSFNVQPGMTWNPWTNMEINFRMAITAGSPGTEFGEKPDSLRPEIWIRYYF